MPYCLQQDREKGTDLFSWICPLFFLSPVFSIFLLQDVKQNCLTNLELQIQCKHVERIEVLSIIEKESIKCQ
jgi:hypothetical protein